MTKFLSVLFALAAITSSIFANATIVEFQTSQGNIQINLYDQTTPKTVENFLKYVEEGHYASVVIHRSVTDFIIQGGGYKVDSGWPLTSLTTNASVINEPIYSNVKGTIAMAKLSGKPNSATDQWFFNLVDNSNNSAKLDTQNGGFTVFGQVIGDGMAVLEKIAQLSQCDADGASSQVFDNLPVVNYSAENCANSDPLLVDNFVVINQIVIVDASNVTDSGLTKPKNTLINQSVEPITPSSSGGGSFAWLLLLLPLVWLRKKLTATVIACNLKTIGNKF
jgi:peptidyl-prolyl cis-trans isomerase A (cyclophilin A)